MKQTIKMGHGECESENTDDRTGQGRCSRASDRDGFDIWVLLADVFQQRCEVFYFVAVGVRVVHRRSDGASFDPTPHEWELQCLGGVASGLVGQWVSRGAQLNELRVCGPRPAGAPLSAPLQGPLSDEYSTDSSWSAKLCNNFF